MDVRSLYTNIRHEEGINAVRNTMHSINPTRSRIVTTFLLLILTLNNFVFNGINYLRQIGCAMGTKCAPTYANLFMGQFEGKHIYPKILNKVHIYLRYIDDIFFIWHGSKQELEHFIEHINQVHPTIKFDCTYSFQTINFLDLTIYKT